jgi:UDP-N-acetylmuramoyl-L-alanyl-D-glutamate--2,6-diaminopimelate ligase
MQLQELASLLMLSHIEGNPETEITGIQTDSRKVIPGDLFICLPGHHYDGHDFAEKAIESGAVALVVQKETSVLVPKLIVNDCRYAMAVIANHFYGYPSQSMKLIGITGTNGKTTITYLLDKILSDQGHRTGLMGTIQMKIGDASYEVKNTTQEALELQQALRKMKDLDTQFCMMEVSSHALQMGRVKGCFFRTAVFTNLSQDHLDYHKTMDQYREAKGLLFSRLGNTFHPQEEAHQFAVLNADDSASEYFKQLTTAQIITYGIDQEADVRASDIKITAKGTEFMLSSFCGEIKFHLQLIGKFSVYNALAAIAASLAEGVPLIAIKNSLEEVKGVDGRFEAVHEGQSFLTIVDYAHTPDGLENVLKTIREFAEGRVYCVFGCGGDRDRTKRPIMGSIAAKYSDVIMITSDNPRTEAPFPILQDIEHGVLNEGFSEEQYHLIEDRQLAIEKAIEMASLKDVVLIAGKGHETYQEINGVRTDFDDRIVAKKAIRRFIK